MPTVRTGVGVSTRKSAGSSETAGLDDGVPMMSSDCVYGTDVDREMEAKATYAENMARPLTAAIIRHVRVREKIDDRL